MMYQYQNMTRKEIYLFIVICLTSRCIYLILLGRKKQYQLMQCIGSETLPW